MRAIAIPRYATLLFFESNLTNILGQTGWVARIVLLLLLIFSVLSWAMIFQKLGLFKRIRRDGAQFLRLYRATRGIADPKALAIAGSPFASVYTAGFRELQSQLAATNPQGSKLKSLSAVTVRMQLAAAEELRLVERGMSWLATTGAVTPFIGLFGTVWGVMDAFSGLGSAAGAASLRVVAPGIAEALVTTAAGLFTAIPAVIFYNQFLQNVRELAQRMDSFALEVTSEIEKTYQ